MTIEEFIEANLANAPALNEERRKRLTTIFSHTIKEGAHESAGETLIAA